MATLSRLMVRIGVDPDGVRRGVNRANRELGRMREYTRQLASDMGRSGRDGGSEFGEGFWRNASGRLHDARRRFARAGEGLGDDTSRGFLGRFRRMMKAGLSKLPDLLKAAAPAAAMGAAVVSALPAVIQLAPAVASLGSAALSAAPALLGLGAGALILKTAFVSLFAEGTAARDALSGLGDMMSKARDAGSRMAAQGIKPLVARLREVAQPTVTRFMEGLGKAANRVQRDFLSWAASAEGIKTLKGILGPLSQMVQDLAPHVSRLVISFASMLGRIMGVSTALGTKGLAGALDWLAKKLDTVNAEKVRNGLTRLGNAGQKVIGVISVVAGWIGKLVQAYKMYTTQFQLVADALAVVAMIFGGPIVTAIAAAGLIIRHFDQIKAGWEKLKAAFQGGGGGGPVGKALQDLKAAAAIVLPAIKTAFQQIKDAVWPVLQQLGAQIKNDIIPTIAAFARAFAPVAAWLIGVLGPVVAQVFKGIVQVISGALNIVSGLIKIFTAVFTGDWSTCWAGIKQICRGAWQIVGAIFRAGVALVKAALQLIIGVIKAVFNRSKESALAGARSIKNSVVGFFRGAGSWLVGAGKALLDGLMSGIRSAIGGLKSLLGKVTGMIPDWKGPMSKDKKLLVPTGKAIMGGLAVGLSTSVPRVRAVLQKTTRHIGAVGSGSYGGVGAGHSGVTVDGDIRNLRPYVPTPKGVSGGGSYSGGGGCNCEIVVKSGGTRFDDALVEILRRAIADKGGNVQKVLGRGGGVKAVQSGSYS